MTRASHWPACTDGELTRIEHSAAVAWAYAVQSDAHVEYGPAGARRSAPALNRESRMLLLALARSLAPGACRAMMRVASLRDETGLSRARMAWCLAALQQAGLTGRHSLITDKGELWLHVDLHMTDDVERARA